MDYKDLWAKSEPYHPLWCHLLDIAAVGKALLPRFGGIEALPEEWILYFLALHDIGKADAEFQNKETKLAEELRNEGFYLAEEVTKFRHEARSADWVQEHLQAQGWGEAANVIGKALRGHHGDFGADAYIEEDYTKRFAQWQPLREELAALVRNVLNPPEYQIEKFDNASVVGVKLVGLTVLSDWIASNHELYSYVKLRDQEIESHAEYFTAACKEAEKVVQSLGLDIPDDEKPAAPPTFHDVWPEIENLRPSQVALEKACLAEKLPPGLLIIEAPMGEGKTEGAVYVSEHWNRTAGRKGAYIALPTMATSNQMHGRYEKFLKETRPKSKPRLIHGMAWLIADDTPTDAPQVAVGGDESEESTSALSWFRNSKRALIAPEGVGTVDQVLRATLNVKHGFLRLLGLSPRVLVIDEVHAYDEYQTVLMERLLEWCKALQIPVILLSATLSRRQKIRLVKAYRGGELPPETEGNYPLLTFTEGKGGTEIFPVKRDEKNKRTVTLESHPNYLGNAKETARLAFDLAQDGGCICVLANTVREAQEIFKELLIIAPDMKEELTLYHARFRAEQRQEIEKKVLSAFGKEAGENRPKRAILVATQVVEQSLDVDFDVMISQLAPIDLLLQRSGRLHRHERSRPIRHQTPVLHILLPPENEFSAFGGTGKVYDPPEPLLRTLALLHDRTSWTLPDEFRYLVEGCYSDIPLPPYVPENLLEKARQDRDKQDAEDKSKAKMNLVAKPFEADFEYPGDSGSREDREEGEAGNFLYPSTRLGSDDRPALLLHDAVLVAAAKSDKSPYLEMLGRLFSQKVNLPGWWFHGVELDEVTTNKKWLQNHLVFEMTGGKWQGRNADGRTVTLTDDEDFGIRWTIEAKTDEGNKEEIDADV